MNDLLKQKRLMTKISVIISGIYLVIGNVLFLFFSETMIYDAMFFMIMSIFHLLISLALNWEYH